MALRRAGRAGVWPLRRFFDPRFAGNRAQVVETDMRLHAKGDQIIDELRGAQQRTAAQVAQLEADVRRQAEEARGFVAEANARASEVLTESAQLLGRELDQMRDEIERLVESFRSTGFAAAVDAGSRGLSPVAGAFLDYAASHQGFRAQEGLWFNDPEFVSFASGPGRIVSINERILETPFVMGAMGRLEPGSRIVDVGCAESRVAISLASLGFRVTAVDPAGYPFRHPDLTIVKAPLDGLEAEPGSFEGAIALSSIEHFGLTAYGQEEVAEADLHAMERLRELLVPGGVLALTVPFGGAAQTPEQRVYRAESLGRLLEGWTVERIHHAAQRDEATWSPLGPDEDPETDAHVALVLATRPE